MGYSEKYGKRSERKEKRWDLLAFLKKSRAQKEFGRIDLEFFTNSARIKKGCLAWIEERILPEIQVHVQKSIIPAKAT